MIGRMGLIALSLGVLTVALLSSSLATGEPTAQPEATSIQATIDAEISRRLQATDFEATLAAGVIRAATATAETVWVSQTQAAQRMTSIAHGTQRAERTQIADAEALFLQANSRRTGVTTTDSGLQYQIVMPGAGPDILPTDWVAFNYRIGLPSGEWVFDMNEHGGTSVAGPVGSTFAGLQEGLQLMRPGAAYRLWIPAHLAFGTLGARTGTMPPLWTLVVDVTITAHWPNASGDPRQPVNRSLLPGERVEVIADQTRLRALPSLDGELLTYLPEDTQGIVLYGPVYARGLAWLNVWFPMASGWVAADYLQPLS